MRGVVRGVVVGGVRSVGLQLRAVGRGLGGVVRRPGVARSLVVGAVGVGLAVAGNAHATAGLTDGTSLLDYTAGDLVADIVSPNMALVVGVAASSVGLWVIAAGIAGLRRPSQSGAKGGR